MPTGFARLKNMHYLSWYERRLRGSACGYGLHVCRQNEAEYRAIRYTTMKLEVVPGRAKSLSVLPSCASPLNVKGIVLLSLGKQKVEGLGLAACNAALCCIGADT